MFKHVEMSKRNYQKRPELPGLGSVMLAELVIVMVPGSLEVERMFSTLKYICNPQRNRLQAQHLTCCA